VNWVRERIASNSELVGVVGAEVDRRLEPLAHEYLSVDGPPLVCARVRLDADRADLFEDFLEFLPKEGMLGIHVLWPSRPYASARAEWLASAEIAGCVDTLVFRDGGDRVPLGANVTVDAFIDLFAQFAVQPRGTTLLHGAGHTARSLISAVHVLGGSKVLVYDPRPGRSNTMVANVQASPDQHGFVEVVDDLVSAFEVADGFADCLNPVAGPRLNVPDGTVRWWFDGPGRLLGAGRPRTSQVLPGWCLSVHRAARARSLWLDENAEPNLVEQAIARMSEAVRDTDTCS
jgi:shikimate 5-dehydrogenase